MKRQLWAGEFWEEGYFARSVCDKATKDMIKKYIKYHKDHERTPQQLDLFQRPGLKRGVLCYSSILWGITTCKVCFYCHQSIRFGNLWQVVQRPLGK